MGSFFKGENMKKLFLIVLFSFLIGYFFGQYSKISEKIADTYLEILQESDQQSAYALVDCGGDADCYEKNGF